MIEVFADVVCPFTHVGLTRLVAHRAELGRDDERLWLRSWPLEVVNGVPVDAGLIAEEVDELRAQVAPDLFTGFDVAAFPATTLPALALTIAGYAAGAEVGEHVGLALRRALFEQGRDVADADVLAEVAAAHGLDVAASRDTAAVLAEHAEGAARGVVGSPHFFVGGAGHFCPSLDISRDGAGLHIVQDEKAMGDFLATCFA